jgi:hypothetical protein
MDKDPYAPPTARLDDIAHPSEAAPVLWNPGAAAALSLLFTPLFGALVQAKNWETLGQLEEADRSKNWAYGIGFFTVVSVMASLALPSSSGLDNLMRFANIGLMIAWYSQSAKRQMEYVQMNFGAGYPRRSWMTPVLCALGATVTFLVVLSGGMGAG